MRPPFACRSPFAAASEQLAWRGPLYIAAGFAGIIALGLVLVQPLLIGGYLPGLLGFRGRRTHYWIGGALVVAVVVHVAGLWITSPPDMIDALTLHIADAVLSLRRGRHVGDLCCRVLAAFRRRLGLAPRTWRLAHMAFAVIIVVGVWSTRLLIEGTMEAISKAALCVLVALAAIKVMIDRRVWRKGVTSRGEGTARPMSAR